jgi:hypothetical protein
MEEVFCLALYESEKKGEESVKKCLAVYESVKRGEESVCKERSRREIPRCTG